MSLWATILIGTLSAVLLALGLILLLLSLYHVRYDIAWFGMWTGGGFESKTGDSFPHENSVRLEIGFPGFMHPWQWSDQAKSSDDGSAHQEHVQSATSVQAQEEREERDERKEQGVGGTFHQPGVEATHEVTAGRFDSVTSGADHRASEPPAFSASAPPVSSIPSRDRGPSSSTPKHTKKTKDPHRHRKAFFRFVTNGSVWKALLGYGVKGLRRAVSLLHARVELSAGHPDPAFLGRMAGHWYALSPLLPTGRATMNFRFQDRHPSFGARVSGGFSLLSLLLFLLGAFLAFPVFRLGLHAWREWQHRKLTGWRAWVYRKIQTL